MKKILCVLLAVSLILEGHGLPGATAGAEEVPDVVTEVTVDSEAQEELVEAHAESALEKVEDSVKEEVSNVVTEVTVDSEAQEELVEAHAESALEKVKNSAKVAAEKAKNSYNKVSAKTKELSALAVKKMKALGAQAEEFYAGLTSKQKILMLAGATAVVGGTALGVVFREELKNSKMAQYFLKLLGYDQKIVQPTPEPEPIPAPIPGPTAELDNKENNVQDNGENNNENIDGSGTETEEDNGEVNAETKVNDASSDDGKEKQDSEDDKVSNVTDEDSFVNETTAAVSTNETVTSLVNETADAVSTEENVTSLVNGTADAVPTEDNVTFSVNTPNYVRENLENNETSSWLDSALNLSKHVVGVAKNSTLKAVDYLQDPPVFARVIGGAAGLVLSVVTCGLFNKVARQCQRGWTALSSALAASATAAASKVISDEVAQDFLIDAKTLVFGKIGATLKGDKWMKNGQMLADTYKAEFFVGLTKLLADFCSGKVTESSLAGQVSGLLRPASLKQNYANELVDLIKNFAKRNRS